MKQTRDLIGSLQATLAAHRVTPKQSESTDSTSMYLLKQLMDKITWVKGDKGEKGERGFTGPRGFKGDTGPMGNEGPRGEPGPKGEQGDPGKDGRDGKDGNADPKQILEIAQRITDNHEKEFDHSKINPFLLGSHKLDESTIGKDKVIKFDGKKLVFADMPKGEDPRQKVISIPTTGAPSHFRIKTVTESYTVDPGDQIIHVDATAGNITVTFYTAQGNEGRHHYIKRVDASSNTVTLAFQGSETWEFELTDQLPNRGSGRTAYAHDGNWFIQSSS